MPPTDHLTPGVPVTAPLAGRPAAPRTPFPARHRQVSRDTKGIPTSARKLTGRLGSAGHVVLLLSVVMCGSAGWAQAIPDELGDLSLQDLVTTKITSVSRKAQSPSKAAAAVYVITQEDIRRSGATSIPEVLRMVPGLQVAQIATNRWAVSSRGFNGQFANKLLVLFDGRSVYSPLFSGVHWDMHDVLLEDIERIEVIRGPGGTMWGVNAVNGVINVITKHTRDTQGSIITAGAGSYDKALGGVRYGARLGSNTTYRFYSKYFQREELLEAMPGFAGEDWRALRGGFRADWEWNGKDRVTLRADFLDSGAGATLSRLSLQPPFQTLVRDRSHLGAANLLGLWTHRLSSSSEVTLQMYYDRSQREELVASETRDTVDVDFQHRSAVAPRHELLWGGGYRLTADRIGQTLDIAFNPLSRRTTIYSGFVQDEWTLAENELFLTVGTRVGRNAYSGWETQPSLQLLWAPTVRHTGWASAARAVRSPNRFDHDLRANVAAFPTPRGLNVLALLGDREVEAENLLAYQTGYRFQVTNRFSLDIATFYQSYSDLITVEPGEPIFESTPPPPHLLIPRHFSNQMDGETYGAEVAVHHAVTEHWKVSGSYSWLRLQLHRRASSRDLTAENAERTSPEHQFHVRSYVNLPWKTQFDSAVFRVGPLPGLGIPGYTRVDARVGWRPGRNWDLSLGAQNVLDNRHPEFSLVLLQSPQSEVRRSVYGRITRRF